jgi:hypothetical protein
MHMTSPYDTEREARDFLKFSCPENSENPKAVVIRVDFNRLADLRTEYIGEEIL